MTYFYKTKEVTELVGSNWLGVLYALASDQLTEALAAPGKHTSCPVHGTTRRKGDGFRLFKDSYRTGGGVCNTCGPRKDGFELLMWLKGWDFSQCLLAVGDFVSATKHLTKKGYEEQKKLQSKPITPAYSAELKKDQDNPKPQKKAQGILVDFGSAPYRNDKANTASYFVVIEHPNGYVQCFWGADLERAIDAAQAIKGNNVTLLLHGKESVTVKREIVDKEGIVGEREIATHRNKWEVINHTPPAVESESVEEEFESVVAVEAPVQQELHKNDKPTGLNSTPEWLQKIQSRMESNEQKRKAYTAGLAHRHQQTWNECFLMTSKNALPAWQYLQGRQLNINKKMLIDGDSIRFHPALPYYNEDQELEGNFPAIVAAIRDVDGNLITLHRIYLSKGEKEDMPYVAKAKKMMPIPEGLDVNGGAIRLGDPFEEGYLGIAEGVETALSAFRATGIPTWSTVNATLMKSIEIPEGVHTVLIWADLDRSLTGEIAANYLKNVLEEKGIKVGILLPKYAIPEEAKSLDWNDVLVDQGILGFPPVRYIKQFFEKQALKELQSI